MKRKGSLVLSIMLLFTMILTNTVFAESVYTVKDGDVLWRIAQEYDTDWETLADYNNLQNPDLIYENQNIKIPGQSNSTGEVKITVLTTADLHGRIYPYEYAVDSADTDAGLAKIQTLVKAERKANENVILMDIGDTTQDNSAELFNKDAVHPMIKALNYMDYDIWTLGNHEFNFEKSFLDNNIKSFEGSVLAANIYKTDGTRFVDGYKIITKEGVRIAVVGLVPPHISTWEAAAPEHFQGLSFTPTVTEAKKVLSEIKGKYDVLVGAFHLGEEGEHGYEGAKAVAEACPEFDVIFMGHAHSKVVEKEVNGVKLVEPGAYGWALAKADITVTKSGSSWTVGSVITSNIETAKADADAEMLAAFAYVNDTSLKDANTVVGTVTADYLKNVDYITGKSTVTTMPTAQVEDTALIDLINDVQLFYTQAQVSSAAAFKNDMNLVAGDFKKKDVANIYLYPNTLMGVNITGANLKAYMEWSASYYNTYVYGDVTVSFNPEIRGYNYDMFAGVTYDVDISKPAGSRITNLLLNGAKIDDKATYKLAINNYRFGTLLGLGLVTDADKYYDSYNLMQDAGRIRDLIIQYITEEKDGKATPSIDNNWKIIGADFVHPLETEVIDLIKSGKLTIPTSEDGRTPNVKSINLFELMKEGLFEDYTTLSILHTNDMHGFFVEGKYDGMGAPKLAAFFNATKAINPNTLILDAGDATQGASLVTLSKGEKAFEILNALKYDAMTTGNHEFDYGRAQLVKNMDMANFPVLAANVKDESGKNFLTPYVIKEIDGIKVAIFGLATPETLYKSHPDNTVGLTFDDPITVAKQMVTELSPQADVIIALAHLGEEGDQTSVALANAVTGIDLIIDGHSHSTYTTGSKVNGTLIVSAGEKTKNVGVVEITLKDKEIVATNAHLFTKATSMGLTDDATVAALVTSINDENKTILDQVIAKAPYKLDGETELVRTGETNLGNLITAALLDISGADVALTNGGGIRTSIEPGDVTKGEVFNVLPYGNTVRVIQVSGADLKAALEVGLKSYPEALGAFPHIAGMTVEFDSTKPAGSRVTTVTVGGQLLDLTKTYKLATNDFVVAGGDGYTMFVGKPVIAEYGAMDEVLIDYVNDKGFDASKVTDRIKDISKAVTGMIEMLFGFAA